jgi:probable rRNA maturation factor
MLFTRNFTKNYIDKKFLEKVVWQVLKTAKIKSGKEISLAIIGEKKIRTLNKKYRGKDEATDVLSFGELENKTGKKFVMPPNNFEYLGEIVICFAKAKQQAKKSKHSVKKELAILLIHGILHLAGFSHKKSEDAEKMKKLEELILKQLFK